MEIQVAHYKLVVQIAFFPPRNNWFLNDRTCNSIHVFVFSWNVFCVNRDTLLNGECDFFLLLEKGICKEILFLNV